MKARLHDFLSFAILCIGLGSASSLSVVNDQPSVAENAANFLSKDGFLGKIVLEDKEPLFGHSSLGAGADASVTTPNNLVKTILANATLAGTAGPSTESPPNPLAGKEPAQEAEKLQLSQTTKRDPAQSPSASTPHPGTNSKASQPL